MMKKLIMLLLVASFAVLLSCRGGSPESASDMEPFEIPPEELDEIFGNQETAMPETDPYLVPESDATAAVKYDLLGLDVLHGHHEIETRLKELHIPVNHFLAHEEMVKKTIEDGTVLNTSLVFIIVEGADENKLKEYYSKVLDRVATEQGWTKSEDLIVLDNNGSNKLIVSILPGDSRLKIDFFDPVK